ncbi:nucleotidyltransferase family protein [Natranaerofaba carboxydovora]|uniref:nucleotidyltransferase family protein n=1 Tax=Natranaerofaba carboxydovora TaxID=2742683 RepID=UPI001F12FEB2|nr:nucleotidyltransferase family protein [Natranaerofaba carboxydovora]UMZ75265.1 MobA-like NTP transferase domain protein [Natranaerofaba carboxydovora]
MTKAVILAGSQKSPEETDGDFYKNKALIKLNGYPMITYIINALSKAEEISEINIVGPKDSLGHILKDYEVNILPEDGTVLDNILLAAETLAVNEGESILLVTSDIPLITPEAIENFLSKCEGSYDLYYPVIDKTENDKRFPELNRTFVKFKEGHFTGGNVFFINPRKVKQCYDKVQKIIFFRKKPVKLAMLLGITFLFRLLTGQLSISQVEKKVSNLLNIQGKAVITPYPELGTDVDKEEDLMWIEKNFFKEKATN